MAVRKEWIDPIVIAQEPGDYPSVRVVRSRLDPAWTRVEQPYSNDPEATSPWVGMQQRVAALQAATRGLARIVVAQADRLAELEGIAAEYKEAQDEGCLPRELFMEHGGVSVYYTLHHGMVSDCHYSVNKFGDDYEFDDDTFDVSDLPLPPGADDRAHAAIIAAAIDAGLIDDEGMVEGDEREEETDAD